MRFSLLATFAALALCAAACGPTVTVLDDDKQHPSRDPASLCGGPGKSITLDGALALQPLQQTYALEGMTQGPDEISVGFGGSGLLFLKDLQPGADESTLQSELAWLRTPWESPSSGAVFCADQATVSIDGDLGDGGALSTSLAGLKKLGTCPGSPVSGDATFCDGACDHMVEGMIDGISLTLNATVGFGGVETALAGGGHLTVRPDGGLMIWMPDTGGPEGSAIYCVESLTPLPDDPSRYQLGGFSRLGSCNLGGPVQGTVDACLSF